MAVDHLMEGAQLFARSAQNAELAGDLELSEFFTTLERMSRQRAQVAKCLLDPKPPS